MRKCAEILKRRGVERLVHFHTDHFEPEVFLQRGAGVVELDAMLRRSKPAKLSAFFRPPLQCYLADGRDPGESYAGRTMTGEWHPVRTMTGDPFAIRVTNLHGRAATLARHLADQADVHVHIHHEYFTQNGRDSRQMTAHQNELHRHAAAVADHKRDSRCVALILATAAAWLEWATAPVDDFYLAPWGFIHGCWALNGSDSGICQVSDEIQLLSAAGCAADFSFPAGRRKCDPFLKKPCWIHPIDQIRSYDSPDSSPRSAEFGFLPELRGPLERRDFLVWSAYQGTGCWNSSLDYYSRPIGTSPAWLERYCEMMPVISGTGRPATAMMKTHAHSLHPHYSRRAAPLENFLPQLLALAQACEAEKISVDFCTAREVMAELGIPQHGRQRI